MKGISAIREICVQKTKIPCETNTSARYMRYAGNESPRIAGITEYLFRKGISAIREICVQKIKFSRVPNINITRDTRDTPETSLHVSRGSRSIFL